MLVGYLKPVAKAMLQSRLAGKFNCPADVFSIMNSFQPKFGFSNQDWLDICKFVLELEKANSIPVAKQVAMKYELEIIL